MLTQLNKPEGVQKSLCFFSGNEEEAHEVASMSIFEYDEERHMQQEREENFAEGLKEGRKEGRKEGCQKGAI